MFKKVKKPGKWDKNGHHFVVKSQATGQRSPGGALPSKPIRDVPFFRVSIFSLNSWTRYKQLIKNSQTGYDYLFKNNRPLFSLLSSDLIIPKQGIEFKFFFLNRLSRFLKNGHLHVMLDSSGWVVLQHGCHHISMKKFYEVWVAITVTFQKGINLKFWDDI